MDCAVVFHLSNWPLLNLFNSFSFQLSVFKLSILLFCTEMWHPEITDQRSKLSIYPFISHYSKIKMKFTQRVTAVIKKKFRCTQNRRKTMVRVSKHES